MNETKTLSRGQVLSFPTHSQMGRMRERGEPIRFTLIDPDGVDDEVEILEHATRAINPEDGHVWWGIICPVSDLETKEGARAIRVICPRDDGVGSYM